MRFSVFFSITALVFGALTSGDAYFACDGGDEKFEPQTASDLNTACSNTTRNLYCYSCDLTGKISDFTPSVYPRLEKIHLSGNQLTGDIREFDLTQKTALRELNLGSNQLTGDIGEFNLTQNINLSTLYLQSNQLTGDIGEFDLTQNIYLWHLYLSSNQLTGDIGEFDLTQNIYLSDIWLQNNQLTGDIGEFDLTQNTALEQLYLFSNQLTGDINDLKYEELVLYDGNCLDNQPSCSRSIIIKLISKTDKEIVVEWNVPDIERSDEIQYYTIFCDSCSGPPQNSMITRDTISGLNPETNYGVKVEGMKGLTDQVSISNETYFQTCPNKMRQDSGSDACFAVGSYFETNNGKALSCEVEIGSGFLETDACLEPGTTVQSLAIRAGFWRPSINTTEIRACPVPRFCSKQNTGVNSGTRRRLDDLEPEASQCALNHRGTYCFNCDEGYKLSLSENLCVECTGPIKEEQERNWIAFGVILSLLILFLVTYVIIKSAAIDTATCFDIFEKVKVFQVLSSIWSIFSVKLRIVESFLQVLFAFRAILYANITSSGFTRFFDAFSNIDLGLIAYSFRVECVVDLNHYIKLLLYTVPPLVLMFLLGTSYRVFTRKVRGWNKEKIKQEMFSIFFIVSFLIFPGASKTIIDTFICETFDTTNPDSDFIYKSALRRDYRLSCNTDDAERVGWLVYASFMVLIYPFGIICTYSYFLFKYKRASAEEEKKRYEDLLYDLIYPYKNERYWFEAYELLRKLLQTSGISIFLQLDNYGNVNELVSVLAMNSSVLSLVLLVYLVPYESITDNAFAVFSMMMLVISTQANGWLNTDESVDDMFITLIVVEIVVMIIIVFFDIFFMKKTLSKALEVSL